MNIKIKWRTASFFESSFVTITNKTIAQHFFSLDKSIFALLDEKQKRTESILFNIQTEIDFNNQKIKIDKNEGLQTNKKQMLILSGIGGVDKTAVIKDLYRDLNGKIPFYVFKGNEFNTSNINEPFNGFDLKERGVCP